MQDVDEALSTQPSGSTLSGASSQQGSIRGRLVVLHRDGTDGQAYPILGDQVDIGSREGDIVIEGDPYMSPRHARLRSSSEGWVLRDLHSANGVYLRIAGSVELRDGDMLLVGQQVLRFEVLQDAELPLGPAHMHGVMIFGSPEVPRLARLVQYTTEGVGRDVYSLYREETVLGRESGDLVFTDDPFMSRRHAAVRLDRERHKFLLTDLGSSNGTAIALRQEHVLRHGDAFRVGRHLLRLELSAVGEE